MSSEVYSVSKIKPQILSYWNSMQIEIIVLTSKNTIFNGSLFFNSETVIEFVALKRVQRWSQILISSPDWPCMQNEAKLNWYFLQFVSKDMIFLQTIPNISKLYTKLTLMKRRIDTYQFQVWVMTIDREMATKIQGSVALFSPVSFPVNQWRQEGGSNSPWPRKPRGTTNVLEKGRILTIFTTAFLPIVVPKRHASRHGWCLTSRQPEAWGFETPSSCFACPCRLWRWPKRW